MNEKKNNVSANAEKRELIEKALKATENEKLDLFKSIVGGLGSDPSRCPAGVTYADSTYTKA